MRKCNIVFFGTPNFASNILNGLIENNYNIIAVVTQPDKEIGRKRILTPTPVKEVATSHNIPVYQPIKLRNDYEFLKNLDIDLIITAAYGQILPQEVLSLAKINAINVHGSLLPLYRGGAPIQRSIINGDTKTGITIIKMVDKMDAGVMYAKKEMPIDININNDELFNKLSDLGKDLLIEILDDIIDNKIEGIPQNEDEVTFAFNIKREEEKLDFNDKVLNVHNKIRGLSSNPGAYCYLFDKELKIYKSAIYSNEEDENIPGTMKIINKNRLLVKCIDGYLELLVIKPEGKQQMDVKSYLNGVDKNKINGGILK